MYADATEPGHWQTSGLFSTAHRFSGIALVEDLFSNRLLLAGAVDDAVTLAVRDPRLEWAEARAVWAPPAGTTVVGVPALCQEVLPPEWGPRGASSRIGDFFIGVGLSSGAVQMLRMRYADAETGVAEADGSEISPQIWPGESDPMPIVALSLAQAPPASPEWWASEFTLRPLEVYSYYGGGAYNSNYFTRTDAGWSEPQVIRTGHMEGRGAP